MFDRCIICYDTDITSLSTPKSYVFKLISHIKGELHMSINVCFAKEPEINIYGVLPQ